MGVPAAVQFGWTVENVARLKERWADGAPASQVATEFGGGLTRSAVLGKVMRLGLSRVKVIAAAKPRVGRTDNGGGTLVRIRNKVSPQGAVTGILHKRKQAKRRDDGDEFSNVVPLPKELPADAIPIAQRKQLVELENHTCRWPYGTPGQADFFYCGSPEADNTAGRVYCPFHTRRAAA